MDLNRIIKEFKDLKDFTPYTEQFKIELSPAKRAEKWAKEVLEEKFGTVMMAEDNEVSFDLLIRKTGETVEVKYDKMSRNTGMVAIEYESYGKPKGIARTTANYYFIVCFDRSWSEIIKGIKKKGMWIGVLIETTYLKELLKTRKFKRIMGGDNYATKSIIVPVDDIREGSLKVYPIIKY